MLGVELAYPGEWVWLLKKFLGENSPVLVTKGYDLAKSRIVPLPKKSVAPV